MGLAKQRGKARSGRRRGGVATTAARARAYRGTEELLFEMRRLLEAGEPWEHGEIAYPGVSSNAYLTRLITGQDFFGEAFASADDERQVWEAVRDDVLTAYRQAGEVGAVPWAHRELDGVDRAERLTRTVRMEGREYELVYDALAAERPLVFIEAYCRLVQGSFQGQPFVPASWLKDLLRKFYGWKYHDEFGRYVRWHRQFALWIPKKVGKTEAMSALGIYHHQGDGEKAPMVRFLSGDYEQAKEVWIRVNGMIDQSPILSARSHITQREIFFQDPDTGAIYEASTMQRMSSTEDSKHGLNASFVAWDELHVVPDKLYKTIRGSGLARPHQVHCTFSTAGDRSDGIGREEFERACHALDHPEGDPRFLPVVYTAALKDPETGVRDVMPDDWDTLAAARRANPGLGTTLQEVDVLEDIREARRKPHVKDWYLRYRLGIWKMDSGGGAIYSRDAWRKLRAQDGADWDFESCAAVAIDLAPVRDLSSAAYLFDRGDGRVGVRWDHWVPEATLHHHAEVDRQRSRSAASAFSGFPGLVDEGVVRTTEGNATDFDVITNHILLLTQGDAWQGPTGRPIVVDPNRATVLMTRLAAEGRNVVPWGQTASWMSGPTELLMNLIESGEIEHDGDPVAEWAIGNVRGRRTSDGGLAISKGSSAQKIDPVSALLFGLGYWTKHLGGLAGGAAATSTETSYSAEGATFMKVGY